MLDFNKNFIKPVVVLTFVITSVLVLATSCKMGLGSTVDTAAPVVSISTPTNSAVCSGDITVAGSFTDDIGVVDVFVSIYNVNDPDNAILLDAVAEKAGDVVDGTYSYTFDSTKYKDGTYKAVVYAKDSVRSSANMERSFDIDNSAPILLLTSPSSVNMTSPTKLGTKIKIAGEVSDSHKVSSMTVKVYKCDDSGNITSEVSLPHPTFTGFSTAGGLSLYIAQLYENPTTEEEQYLNNNYNAIYDINSDIEAQKIKIFVSLTDIADNTSETVYLYDGISDTLNSIADGWTADNLRDIYAGTYSGSISSTSQNAILSLLNGNYSDLSTSRYLIKDAENMACVSVNKNANPNYEVQSCKIDLTKIAEENNSSDDENTKLTKIKKLWGSASSEGSIAIKVSAGLNDSKVKPNSLKVVIYTADKTGYKLDTTDSGYNVYTIEPDKISDLNGTLKTSDSGEFIVDNDGTTVKGSDEDVSPVESGVYSVTLPSIPRNSYYIVEVLGEDKAGYQMKVLNKNVYGFYVQPLGEKPVIIIDSVAKDGTTLTNPENQKYYNVYPESTTGEKKLKFKGIAYTKSKFSSATPKWTVKATRDDGGDPASWSGDITFTNYNLPATTGTDFANEMSFDWITGDLLEGCPSEIKTNLSNGDRYKFDVTFTISNNGGDGVLQRSFNIDTDAPVIDWGSTSPVIDENNSAAINGKVNGTIIFNINAQDGNFDSLTLEAKSDGESEYSVVPQTNDNKQKYIGSYSTIGKSGNLNLRFTAVDKAGNKTIATKLYTIDQSTDAPNLAMSNATAGSVTITKDCNMFTKDGKLIGNLSDDDGVDSVTVAYKLQSANDYSQPKTLSGNSSVNLSLVDLITDIDEQLYDVKFTVADKANEATGYNTSEYVYHIGIDSGAPSFIIKSETGQFAGSTHTVEGTLSEGSLNYSNDIYMSFDGGSTFVKLDTTDSNIFTKTVGNHTFTYTKATQKWTDVYTGITQSSQINYVVKDKYDQKSSVNTYSYYYDVTSPEAIDNPTVSSDYSNKNAKTLTLHIIDKVDNLGMCSGIYSVSYTITKPDGTVTAETNFGRGTIYKTDATGVCYNYSTTFTLEDGLSVINIKATDTVGNENANIATYTYNIDTVAPSITSLTINNVTENKVTKANKDNVSISTDSTGIVETLSKVKTLYLYKGSTTVASESFDSTATSYSIAIPGNKINEGDNSFTLVAEDNAGNKSDSYFISLSCDITPPEVKVSLPATGSTIDNKVIISGSVSDKRSDIVADSGKLYVYKKDNNNNWNWTDTGVTLTVDGDTWYTSSAVDTATYTAAAYDTDGATSGVQGKFKAVFSDTYDNTNLDDVTNGVVAYTIDQNNDRPVITMSTLLLDGTKIQKNSVEVTGKIVDYDVRDDYSTELELYYITKADYDAVSGTKPTAPTSATTYDKTTNPSGIWHKATVESDGSFTATYTGEDGQTTWYFYVKEMVSAETGKYCASTKEYFTLSTNALARPYLLDKTAVTDISNTAADNTTGLTFRIDTNQPVFVTQKVYITDTQTPLAVNSEEWLVPSVNIYAGGNKKYLYALIEATDANGIKAIESTQIPTSSSVTVNYDDSTGRYRRILGPFDVSSLSSGQYDINFTIIDNSDLSNNSRQSISIDNSAPVISATYPTSTDIISDEFDARGTITDNNASGLASIYWIVPKKTEVASLARPTTATTSTDVSGTNLSDIGKWHKLETGSTWDINFINNTAETHAKYFHNFAIYNTADYATEEGTGYMSVPIYFWVEDNLGNSALTPIKVYTDPDAAIPKAVITYPTEGISTGGIIQAYGTASDNAQVSAVYMQIDADGDGDFDDADKTIISRWTGYTVENITVKGISTWGIKIDVTPSKNTIWNISLNQNGELDGQITATNNGKFALRVVAKDNDPQFGKDWTSPVEFTVDGGAPSITNVYLTQYDGNTQTAKRAYTADMWLKGKWYLEADFTDDSGISEAIIKADQNKGSLNVTPVEYECIYKSEYGNEVTQTGKKSNYHLKLALFNGDNVNAYANSSGNITSVLTVYDYASVKGDRKNSSMTISLNLDNEAPSVFTSSLNEETNKDGDLSNNLRLMQNGYSQSGVKINSTNVITQSNYEYTLGDQVFENKSGFERVVFYFERVGATETRVYDPTLTPNDKAVINTTLTAGTTDGQKYINSDKLPVIYAVGTRSSTTAFELSSASGYIKAGGIVKIGGVYHKINQVNGTTVYFEDEVDTTFTKAEFVIGQVVDHLTEESGSYNSSSNTWSVRNDDGDGMIESLSKSGSLYSWSASINSKNIPDGPIQIHTVTFDKAGNSVHGYITTAINNNRPRITKIWLGTDLDGNGTVTNKTVDSEFTEYTAATGFSSGKTTSSINEVSTTYVESGTLNSASFTAKSDLAVVPEFVGVINGTTAEALGLKYTLTCSENTAISSPKTGTGTSLKSVHKSDDSRTVGSTQNVAYVSDNTSNMKLNNGFIYMSNSDLTAMTVSGMTYDGSDDDIMMSFTFWDNTEETTQGTDSQYAIVNIPLKIDVVDSKKPKTVINKFYWNSLTENSTYIAPSAEITSVADLAGHIELEDDLSVTLKTLLGDDPKVSGKIVLRGTAFDDHYLKSLYFSFGDITPKLGGVALTSESINSTNVYKISDYDNSNNSWTGTPVEKDGTTIGYTRGSMTTDGFIFTVYKDSEHGAALDQRGHTVYWELAIDTEKISKKAELNVVAKVYAKDAKGNAVSVASADINTTNKPTYQMDVVPYLTKIETYLYSLASSSVTAASVYNRNSSGAYPVRVIGKDQTITGGEDIKIYGFNLDVDYISLNAKDISDKNYSYKVNNIASINNSNNDNANGGRGNTKVISSDSSYTDLTTYAYNRIPNNSNNNRLTDDVIFEIWQFNSSAAVPKSGKIEQPVMSINPTNGKIGFAFVNGPLYFSMGGSSTSEDYSYQYWLASFDFFSSVGFTYDDNGNSWGVAAGGDINSTTGDKFFLASSKFGTAGYYAEASRNSDKIIRMERIAQINSDGVIDFEKQRVKSPSIVSTVSGSDTNLYLAYFDSMNNEIRFKSGNMSDSKSLIKSPTYIRRVYKADNEGSNYAGAWVNKTEGGNTLDLKNGYKIILCDKDGNQLEGTEEYTLGGLHNPDGDMLAFVANLNGVIQAPFPGTPTDSSKFDMDGGFRVYKEEIYVKIMDKYYGYGSFIDDKVSDEPAEYENETVSLIAGGNTGNNPGQYVSLAAIKDGSNDTVVAVWYDETARKLKYAYNTTPLTNRDGTKDFSGWTGPYDVFTGNMSNAGEYCKVVADANGGIHIAAYDPVNLDLVYAYLPASKKGKATKTGDFETCIVDSNGVVGSNLTLDVALNNSTDKKAIPYIGYYATSCIKPKMAYLSDTSANAPAGSTADKYTGKWEITVLPTESTIEMQSSQHNDINIGVWKDSGVIKNSVTGTTTNTGSGSGYGAASNGQIYGNGTSNPVLGYAVKSGSTGDTIETAQKK